MEKTLAIVVSVILFVTALMLVLSGCSPFDLPDFENPIDPINQPGDGAPQNDLDRESGIVAAYTFSSDFLDAGPFGLHGVSHGVVFGEDRSSNPDSAAYFNGSSYVAVYLNSSPAMSEFPGRNTITVAAWVNPIGIGAGQWTILGARDPEHLFQFAIMGDKPYFSFWLDGGDYVEEWFFGETTIPDGIWTHMAVTYDGQTVLFYVNGVPESISKETASYFANRSSNFFIGAYGDWNELEPFEGFIDELLLFSRALNQAEIENIFNEGL